MGKLIVALSIALILLMASSPVVALADEGVSVELSEISVDSTGEQGSEATASGTVTITAEAGTLGFIPRALAESTAWFTVTSPGEVVVDSGSSSVEDSDIGLFYASADASQVYDWSSTFALAEVGEWVIAHGGDASTDTYALFAFFWHDSDEASDTGSAIIEATAMNMGFPERHRMLVIEIDGYTKYFFNSNGYGDGVLTQDISFSKNGLQVELAAGTVITMDGEWHKQAWLVFEEDGSYTGSYGSLNAHKTNWTPDIGFSIPMVVFIN